MNFPASKLTELVYKLKQSSPYYSDRYESIFFPDSADFDYHLFSQLPLLERDDVLYKSKTFGSTGEVLTRVHFSGGTLGQSKSLYYTESDWKNSIDGTIQCLRIAGVTHADRVAILQPFGAWSIGSVFLESVSRIGCLGIPIGIHMNDSDIADLLADLRPTVIMAAPANLCRITSKLFSDDEMKYSPDVRLLILSGEMVLRGQAEYLSNQWGAAVRSLYGSAETDSLAVECACNDGLHLCDDEVFAEILTEAGPQMLSDGLEGELVITTLRRNGTPLIRYRVGDKVRCQHADCSCGTSSWKLKVTGRTEQTLCFKDGTKVYSHQIYQAIHDRLSDFVACQVILSEHENGNDLLECTIFKEGDDKDDTLCEDIIMNIRRCSIDLQDVLKSGILAEIRVNVRNPDLVEMNQRGKVVFLRDVRISNSNQSSEGSLANV